jgi:N-acetylglucosamine kinase-like BadF-type ATPase
MRLYIGIDAGQTSTKCVLGDETGNLISAGQGEAVSHWRDAQSRTKVKEVLNQVVLKTVRTAGLQASIGVEAVFLGYTGVSTLGETAARVLAELVGEIIVVRNTSVDHDAQVALAGAIPSMTGIIVIAGTGSLAYGIDERGNRARAGGWGYLIGDPGSGYEIGRQALAAVARYHDGTGPTTDLAARIMRAFSIEDLFAIKQVVYLDPDPKKRVAALAPFVSQAAHAGDQVALEILSAAGKDLGKMICAVARKLNFENGKFLFSVTGGVVNCGDLLRTPFEDEVLSNFPAAERIVPRFPAHCGAYLMALRAGGISVTEGLLNRMEGTLFKII